MTESIKLDRTLGLWSVVLFGLAYMTPMIVFGTFGALASVSAGTTAMAYFIAAAAIFLTAVSYGIMARVYPVAGSAYTYARKSLNSCAGFLVGWAAAGCEPAEMGIGPVPATARLMRRLGRLPPSRAARRISTACLPACAQ